MSQGYTLRLRDLNAEADDESIGVRLGRTCIAQGVPVQEVARAMGVSRATVYNWFCGTSVPQATTIGKIEDFLAGLE